MKKFIVFAALFLITAITQVSAQCAMCRATVENNVNNGEIGVETGLNFGILYLFAAPYTMAMIIGFLWYRQSKKTKKKINIHQILNRNS